MDRKVYVVGGMSERGEASFRLISEAASRADAAAFRLDRIAPSASIGGAMVEAIQAAQLVVLDLVSSTPNVMYEAGMAFAQGKPLLAVITGMMLVPLDLAGVPVFRYDLQNPEEFVDSFASAIADALSRPDHYVQSQSQPTGSGRRPVFISYSHVDQEYLERLIVHLKPLERDGLIDLWVDTRLRPGDTWKRDIATALDRAKVAILMVSADFLASDFIVNDELPPLLTAAEQKGTRIIPLILKPCRFARDNSLRHLQAVNDPSNSLICCTEDQQEALYDAVAAEVERLCGRG